MGNVNVFEDPMFQVLYGQLQKQFLSEDPLFDVQKIKFPLSTCNMRIVDSKNQRVKLCGANWSGAHMKRHCVSGLQHRPLKDLCTQIRKKFDFNCVRLTFSLQMFYSNNVLDKKHLTANPQLFGKTALQVFDITIKQLTNAGLMVFLNNHTSKSQWCCSNSDGDGLWHNTQYPESKFFNCLQQLTKRYCNNPRVIGMDLRNEIRKGQAGSPTWGDGNPQTDWKMAAQTAGNKVLAIAPHWLIIVGGINYQLDLTGVYEHPITLNVKNKLVYSGHFYSFSWIFLSSALTNEDQFRKKIFNEQFFVRKFNVPFLLGEFGNNNKDLPWKFLIKYLKELDIDWTYWCLDGYKCDQQEDQTYGIWDRNFKEIRHPELFQDLKKIGRRVKGITLQQK